MEFNEAIEHAIDGNAVLFIGSGFSFGAKNISGSAPLSGRALAKKLYNDVGVETDDYNLALASQMFVRTRSLQELSKLVREMFIIRTPGDYHIPVASISWRRVYTTNYDNLFELSANQAGRAMVPVVLSDPPEKYLSESNVCVHINGHIEKMVSSDLNNQFKLTFESYLTDEFTPSKWSAVFRNDIALAQAVIFIGYSMYDLDIQRIVSNADIRDKAIFIVSPDTKPTSPDGIILPTFGTYYPIGVKAFGDAIVSIRKTYAPKSRPQNFVALKEMLPAASLNEVRNVDVEGLFLYGDLVPELMSLTSGSQTEPTQRFYLLNRGALELAEEAIKHRDVVFTSELGNGKTVAVEQLCLSLAQQGWKVYKVETDDKETRRELDRLLRLDEKILLAIDPYIPFLDLIDFVSVRRQGKQIRFVLTARSNIHEAYLDRLEESLRTTEIVEVDVNKLSPTDVKSLTTLVDSFGLWADFSAYTPQQKNELLVQKCESQLHQFLLKFYSSPQISSKIKEIFSSFTGEVEKIVIGAFILKGTGLPVDKRYLNDLLNNSPILRLSNIDKTSLQPLWDETGGQLRLKSSVLAEYYLTNLASAAKVASILSEMFTNAHKLQTLDKEYVYFMRSVMTYSALQKIIPKSGLRNATINFYESIQTFKFTQRNPHYWLQYAIARLSLEDDHDAVETYFKSAYSFAKGSGGYDTFQIDNHYARFLLAKSVRSTVTANAYNNFIEATQILRRQMFREVKHYPYRVAKNTLDFYRMHEQSFNSDQRKGIRAFCEDVLERINKLPKGIQDHRHVTESAKSLQTVLKEMEGK